MICTDETASPTPRGIRLLASVLFIGLWMAIGFLLHLDANSYLVVGIPLTIIFQVAVKKEPLRALWLRSAPRLKLTGRFYAIIGVLMIVPITLSYQQIKGHDPAPFLLWGMACIAGVFAAGYALLRFDRTTLSAFLKCLATGGVLSIGLLFLALYDRHKAIPPPALLIGAQWFLLYFPVSFTIEEVSFRGAIDAYVHRSGETHPWLSALFVSALWGLWHLPTMPQPTVSTAVSLVLFTR